MRQYFAGWSQLDAVLLVGTIWVAVFGGILHKAGVI